MEISGNIVELWIRGWPEWAPEVVDGYVNTKPWVEPDSRFVQLWFQFLIPAWVSVRFWVPI